MASEGPAALTISSHDLAREIHTHQDSVFLLDCRPVFSFNSCHISGAANINLTGLMRKRFVAGKIGLADLVNSSHGKKLLQSEGGGKVVVYDEATTDPNSLPPNTTAFLVIAALRKMGKAPLLLEGGISEFGVLHPSLCEVSVCPVQRPISSAPRATTPGRGGCCVLGDESVPRCCILPVQTFSYGYSRR
jgi:dual specificity MAP kinase phosphatase